MCIVLDTVFSYKVFYFFSRQVIILWTANTERFCDVREGLNDTANTLLESIKRNESEISASTLFAVASILERVSERII